MAYRSPPSIVIAVSGPSGSGKSTLAKRVTALLGDAVSMFFDDYNETTKWPADANAWITAGAAPDVVGTPQLAADLAALRSGNMITLPHNKGTLAPAPFIVLEEPFGRTRQEMAALIDFVVCIDLLWDVALARRVFRDVHHHFKHQSKEELVVYLEEHLGWYREYGYNLYRAVNNRALATADLVVNGLHPPEEIAQAVVQAIKGRFG
jgi:uridine kinase